MKTETIQPHMIARISSLDLKNGGTDADWERISSTWRDHPILVFPDQSSLSTQDQSAFLSRFGRVIEERMPGEQHSFVSNDDGHGTDEMTDGYREGELTPHMDYTYTPYPADAISLFAVSLPDQGTETHFYSNQLALERMPTDLRDELARYSIFCAHDLALMKPDAQLYREARTVSSAPTQSHTWPLVREHPSRPGVKILMCTLQQTERIIELEDPAQNDHKSREMLGRIFDDFLYIPENEYIHKWSLGDLVVWDNLAVQHARRACPRQAGPRSLRRVAICDAGNAIHETVAFLNLSDSSVAFSES